MPFARPILAPRDPDEEYQQITSVLVTKTALDSEIESIPRNARGTAPEEAQKGIIFQVKTCLSPPPQGRFLRIAAGLPPAGATMTGASFTDRPRQAAAPIWLQENMGRQNGPRFIRVAGEHGNNKQQGASPDCWGATKEKALRHAHHLYGSRTQIFEVVTSDRICLLAVRQFRLPSGPTLPKDIRP